MQAVDDALVVVEVEEHLGALRDGTQQIAEFAERVLSNRAVVLDERERTRNLVHAHREMVFPEVRHHLEQLPIARHGADENRRTELADRRLARRQELGELLHQHRGFGEFRLKRHRVERLRHRIAGCLAANFGGIGLFACLVSVLVRLRMVGIQLERRLVRDLEAREHAVGDGIGDALRVELPIDPGAYADAFDLGEVGGAGAERQAVERLTRAAGIVEFVAGRRWRGAGRHDGLRATARREGERQTDHQPPRHVTPPLVLSAAAA